MAAAERKYLTMPPDWWAAFERHAERTGVSVSEWLGAAGVAKLTATERKRLSVRTGRGRPKSPSRPE